MIKNGSSLDQRTFQKLSRLYVFALSTIAVSVFCSQILVRNHLKDQQTDSSVINVAGRQRMLSQKLTKEILFLSSDQKVEDKIRIKDKIKKTLHVWEFSHYALQKGNDSLGLPEKNSREIIKKFTQLQPYFVAVSTAAKSIIEKIENAPEHSKEVYLHDIAEVKKNEGDFLVIMDQIVNQYDIEADAKVSWLRKLELWLTILTLLILLGEFLFILWPTAKNVKAILSELLMAENRAKEMAYEADQLIILKEKSIRELRVLTYAIDQTLLFARIKLDGAIVHIGSKFSRLFKISNFYMDSVFWKVITVDQNEQLEIEKIITKNAKKGWQGELKTTTKENKDIWLGMSIIPVSYANEMSELLIVASDITERRKAQLEIERLNKKSFEDKMVNQKLVSSKIIENQEKEQNRIAKDVHDGIGQMLTGLKFNLESIDLNDVAKAADKVEYLKELTANIIKGVRTATFNLTPPELSDHGVVPAIAKLVTELAKLTGKEIVFINKTDFNTRLDSLVEINIYRITQEAINNAIKYANSTHIIVSMSHSEKMLSVVVDDNGIGFDKTKVKKVKEGDGGMGMTFMRERISYIEGRLFLNSEEGVGTRVTINIPI